MQVFTFRFLFFILLILLIGRASMAQKNNIWSAVFLKKIISGKSGGTCLTIYQVINKSEKTLDISPKFTIESGCQIITKVKDKYNLKPGDTIIIPLRVYISGTVKGNQEFKLTAILSSSNTNEISESICKIKAEANDLIFATLENSTVFFKPEDISQILKIQLRNQGNTDQNLKFEYEFTQELSVDSSKKRFSIRSGIDTFVLIKIERTKKFNPNNSYTIILTIFDNNNRGVNSFLIHVVVLASIKKFQPDNSTNSQLANHIEYRANALYTNSPYYNFNGWGNIPFNKKNDFIYRYRSYFFDGGKTYFLRDAFITFQREKNSFTLGDQTESYEKNIYGRGLGIKLNIGKNDIQGLFVHNAYQSFSSEKQNLESVNSGMLKNYYTINDRLTNTSTVIQQFDETQNKNSSLILNEVSFIPMKEQSIKFLLGGSTEKNYNDSLAFNKNGIVAKLDYQGTLNRFTFQSQNYISSRNYAGSQRGVQQLTEQVSYVYNPKNTFGFLFKKISINPDLFFKGKELSPRTNSSTSTEVQYTFKNRSIVLNLKPGFVAQDIHDELLFGNGLSYFSSVSFRIISDMQYRFSETQNVSLNIDAGKVKPVNIDHPDFFTGQFRAKYTIGSSGISTLINEGPYYIFEQLNYLNTGKYGRNYTISPYIGINFLKKRIKCLFIGNYGYDSYFNSERRGLTQDLQIDLPYNFKLTEQMDLIILKNFNRKEIRFSAEKNFGKVRFSFHEIQVSFFVDDNGNKQRDPGEPGLKGLLVSINKANLITDSTGKVIYKRLPKGEYKVHLLGGNEYFTFDGETQWKIFLSKNTVLNIPMVKGNLLKGKINIQKDKFTLFNVLNLTGIRITAKDSAGNNFYTLTNDQGEFMIFLPVNSYVISINKNALSGSFEIENPIQPITIAKDHTNEIQFNVKEKKRQVSIKKFDNTGKMLQSNEKPKDVPDTLFLIHTVEINTNIYTIAKKYNMKPEEILNLNKLRENKLYPGQELKVYRLYYAAKDIMEYKVIPSNSVLNIAKMFNMSEQEVLKLNNLKSYTINKGEVLKVFKPKTEK